MKKELVIAVVCLAFIAGFAWTHKKNQAIYNPPTSQEISLPKIPTEITLNVTKISGHLEYQGIKNQLIKWNKEAPNLTEVGTYGKTKKGEDLYYFRIYKPDSIQKPKVLIISCIHGNEPWAAGITMNYISNLLCNYDKPEIKELVNSRDLYFIPVVSPDSYPHSRYVDGVDPNRDFPVPLFKQSHEVNRMPLFNRNRSWEEKPTSIPPIAALQKFTLEIKPNAVVSGHTSGRKILIPYGFSRKLPPHESEFKRIAGNMASSSKYQLIHTCDLYGKPISGGEIDWFYANDCFTIVMEYGTHQRIPTQNEITDETNLTWDAMKLFIKEAPLVITNSQR